MSFCLALALLLSKGFGYIGSTNTRVRLSAVERPTLIESFVRLLHIPYFPGAIVLSLLLTGPGELLARYLDTLNLEKALSATLQIQGTFHLWQVVLRQISYTALTLYQLAMARYVRLRVVAAEDKLVALLPKGKKDFDRVFGNISRWYGPFPPAAVMLLLFLGPVLQSLRSATGLFYFIQDVAGTIAQFVVGGTMIWVYLSCIYGMFRIGRLPLRMKPYHADSMLGLRPFGALSLSLAYAYFGSILFLLLHHWFDLSYASRQLTALLVVLTALGVLMFFFPLIRLHKRMQQTKQRERALLRTRFAQLAESLHHDESPSNSEITTLKDIKTVLMDLKTLTVSSTIERHLASMPTWPIDLRILARLGSILLAIVTGLVVRLITVRIGL